MKSAGSDQNIKRSYCSDSSGDSDSSAQIKKRHVMLESSLQIKSDNIRRRTWERRADQCKKRHRPKLKDWGKDKFGTSRISDFQNICSRVDDKCIDRFKAGDISVDSFILNYEVTSKPCIISEIPEKEQWKAVDSWDFKKFKHLKNRMYKVGEDDNGKTVKVPHIINPLLRLIVSIIDENEIFLKIFGKK